MYLLVIRTRCEKEFECETRTFADFLEQRKACDHLARDTPPNNDSAARLSSHRAGKISARITAMKRRALLQSLPAAALLPASAWASVQQEKADAGQGSTMVYELRIYHAAEGKLDDLLRRFREHTTKLFEKHGIKNVAYWTATDEPLKGKTLVYILAHPSREAADANWKAFREDPEWISVRDKSEANGKLVEKIEFTFLEMTDFSPRLH
jgi:hypothetical protein